MLYRRLTLENLGGDLFGYVGFIGVRAEPRLRTMVGLELLDVVELVVFLIVDV